MFLSFALFFTSPPLCLFFPNLRPIFFSSPLFYFLIPLHSSPFAHTHPLMSCPLFPSPPPPTPSFCTLRPSPSIHPSVHPPLQALTCSPTARRSARPWAIPTAAGCPPSCRPTGARGRTTAATCTCPAWTPRCPTLRYPPLSTSPTNSP